CTCRAYYRQHTCGAGTAVSAGSSGMDCRTRQYYLDNMASRAAQIWSVWRITGRSYDSLSAPVGGIFSQLHYARDGVSRTLLYAVHDRHGVVWRAACAV